VSANFIPRQLPQLTDSANAPLPDVSAAEMGCLDGVTSAIQAQLDGKYGSGAAIVGTSFTIGAHTLDTNEWTHLDGQDQAVKTTSSPTFAGLGLGSGNLTTTGTVAVGGNSNTIQFVAKQHASQTTANIAEFQNSSGAMLFGFYSQAAAWGGIGIQFQGGTKLIEQQQAIHGNDRFLFLPNGSNMQVLTEDGNGLIFSASNTGVCACYNFTIGAGAAGIDYTLTFDGQDHDGIITWMEDEDYFKFSDDILLNSTEALYFRDTALAISSKDDGHLDLDADASIDLNTPSLRFGTLPPMYANNNAAVAGGLTAGQVYRTGGDPDALCIVH
jgi:hypothetical protein